MDGITAMQGPGPARGIPARTSVLIGSVNPVALDVVASSIAGYDPMVIPTNRIAIERGLWLDDPGEIEINGPGIQSLVVRDFNRIPVSKFTNISAKFVLSRIKPLRRFQRRPVFISNICSGCHKCIRICPVNAITARPVAKNRILLTDSKCIRCFCCSEVCGDNAVEIRRKLF
jgi:ferredoxin